MLWLPRYFRKKQMTRLGPPSSSDSYAQDVAPFIAALPPYFLSASHRRCRGKEEEQMKKAQKSTTVQLDLAADGNAPVSTTERAGHFSANIINVLKYSKTVLEARSANCIHWWYLRGPRHGALHFAGPQVREGPGDTLCSMPAASRILSSRAMRFCVQH